MYITELLHQNAVADNELLYKNDEQGDVFSTPRNVDFALRTPDKKRAEIICEFINQKNYGRARMENKPPDDLFWIFVDIHMPINQHVLCSVSGFMVCLAKLFDVEYDGWGSVIQSAQNR